MSDSTQRPKSLRLVRFLEELVRMRSRRVTDVDSYEHVLWLDKLPEEPECYSRHRDPAQDDDPDLWVEVSKPREPRLPAPPEECRPWLAHELDDDPNTEPTLRETILQPISDQSSFAGPISQSDQTESGSGWDTGLASDTEEWELADHPEIVEEWRQYIDTSWRPWAEARKRWMSIQKKYAKLFEMHSHLQTRGEQVELLIGVGLLRWSQSPTAIRRHLVTARVDMQFDERRGRFEIRPHSAGVSLRAEFDMLPPELHVLGMEETAQEGLQAAGDDIWDRGAIDAVLSAIAHQLAEDGEYVDDDASAGTPCPHPVVSSSPVVLVRRRSERSVQQFLREMHDQVESGVEAPQGWLDLCEDQEDGEEWAQGPEKPRTHPTPDRTYLPLPTNEEQERILNALNHPIGALVQGPPGTGKSHTIANLVCHLLATGKRILITAQTGRALDVLRSKLPEEIRPLAVSLLGNGADEQRSLEESVQGIAGRFDQRHAHEFRDLAQRAARQRAVAMRTLAELQERRRATREQDTRTVSIANYRGTAQEIAKDVARQASEFSWFSDTVHHSATLPVSLESLTAAVTTFRRLLPEARDRLSLTRPKPGADLPDVDTFRSLVQTYRHSRDQLETADPGLAEQLSPYAGEDIRSLNAAIEQMRHLEVAVSNAAKRPQRWIESSLRDVLSKRDRPWFELHISTERALDVLRGAASSEDQRRVDAPDDASWSQLRNDADELIGYLRSGGRLRLWMIKDRSVRRLRYLTTHVRVDGRLCDNVDTLKLLSSHAEFRRVLEHAWRLWTGHASPESESVALQVREIEELLESLSDVLGAYRSLEDAMAAIGQVPGLAEPDWQSHDARRVAQLDMRVLVAQSELRESHLLLEDIREQMRLCRSTASADTQTIDRVTAAVEALDPVQYAAAIEELRGLEQDAASLSNAESTLEALTQDLPALASEIRGHPDAEEWDSRIPRLPRAFDHARARQWLAEFIDGADSRKIEQDIARTESRLQQTIATEASHLAWAHAFERMKEPHRRALMSWQQAIKALGKGTGKYAFRHRREAQSQLQKCRPAIPAWIMPLHRVFDGITPEPGVFDVVIVDEASQCGPDALPLFFIGKKVLIVGDDKQISPSHVGLNRENVHQRIREYLGDFEHRGSFDLERSLFDHGELRIGNRIVLREHFRCMPEIIRFSNDLCYGLTPLMPLRQYPPQRLDPLVSVHVSDGCREGTGSAVVNRPEAERLVDAVLACCEDSRYAPSGDKRTFGVISLQGWSQAEHIEHLLIERLGAEEMAQRRLLCGDAYSFQGDERDVVFLSMVAAPNARTGPMTRFQDQQRFNVAASRARDQLWLFHSVTPDDLNPECVRRRLLEHFIDPSASAKEIAGVDLDELSVTALRADRQSERPPEPFDSWFEVDVALDLSRAGYRVTPQFEIGGYRVDLVVEGGQSRLAVECDGDHWHGADRYEYDLARQRKLERAGWTFERVRGSAYYSNPQAAIESVRRRLDELGIGSTDNGYGNDIEFTSCSDLSDHVDEREDELNEPHCHEPAVYSTTTPAPPVASDTASVPNEEQVSLWAGHDGKSEAEAETAVTSSGGSSGSGVRENGGLASEVSPMEFDEYVEWQPRPLEDPRKVSADAVLSGLKSIIDTEGPIVASRACQIYARAAGISRVGSDLRRAFNRALYRAKKTGLFEFEQSEDDPAIRRSVVRLAGEPTVWIRKMGSRSMSEIPESELAAVMQKLLETAPSASDETVFRQMLELYGLQRLRGSTRERLMCVWNSLQSH
jgi:very-short-patch-repair endonuclease